MTCVDSCSCRCGQTTCGCHVSKKTAPLAAVSTVAGMPTKPCSCGRNAIAHYVKSDAGKLLTVIFCGRCDLVVAS